MKKKTKILISSLTLVSTGAIVVSTATSCSFNLNLLSNLSPGALEDDKAAYINNNTISLLFNILPDYDGIQIELDNLLKEKLLDIQTHKYFSDVINKKKNDTSEINKRVIVSGNGWIINFDDNTQKPQQTTNKYYVLTNSHVCNMFYKLQLGDTVLKFPWKYFKSVDLKIKQTYTGFNVNDVGDYEIKNITSDSIINIGTQSVSSPYNYCLSINNNDYLIDNNYKTSNYSDVINSLDSTQAIDAAIIAIDVDPKVINNLSLKKLFSTDLTIFDKPPQKQQLQQPIQPYEKTIVYRLIKSLTALQNNNMNEFNSLFPFKKLDSSYKSNISLGGYQSTKQNGNYFVDWTGFTTNVSAINPLAPISRATIEYSNNNGIVLSKYSQNNNCCILGTHLTNGSSGSMVIDDDYNIIGIHWGSSSDNLYSQFIPLYKSYLTPYYSGKSLMEMIFELFRNDSRFRNSIMYKILGYLK